MRMLLMLLLAVSVKQGEVTGVQENGVTVYRGIPYAAPPVDTLRLQAPQPAAAWAGVRKAEKFGPNCVQKIVDSKAPWTSEFMAHGGTSEDCLYLNIWTTARSAADRRPVFVWVHGGAFREGSGSIAAYDGTELAKKGLVVVTINYRVGDNGAPDYGLLDQVAALRWVRANIRVFGGDPFNVTLAGQSAGGMSVHALASSAQARGLFHRMIVESGRAGRKLPDAVPEADIPVLKGMNWDEGDRAKGLAAINDYAEERARTAHSNAYTYIFDHVLPGPDSAKYKVFHTSEVPYVFNSLAKSDRPFTADDKRLAEMMSSYWANFAANGDPNGKGLPPWPAFKPGAKVTMEVGDKNAPVSLP